jgi:VWFA-related protein
MRTCVLRGAVITCVLYLPAALHAQQSPTPPTRNPEAFTSGTAGVLVDVVVRDRNGRPVTDLEPGDFELFEDGVRQRIAAVSAVVPGRAPQDDPVGSRQAATERAAAADATRAPAPAAMPSVVALVFDRLSPNGRALAHRGAQTYLTSSQPGEFAGVFLIDESLETMIPFTSDREAVRVALDEVAVRVTSGFGSDGGKSKTTIEGDTDLGQPLTAGAEYHGPPSAMTPSNPDPSMKAPGTTPEIPDNIVNRMRYLQHRLATNAERFYRLMMHEKQGRATAAGLLALVDALGALQGRKTIVFFAESLLIPPSVEPLFHAVVAAANRANVSIYAVDAAGLRVHSAMAQTANQMNALGAVGVGDIRDLNDTQPGENPGPGQHGERGDRAWTKDLELNEDILRQDPAATLGALARHTGGFLINNTNDLEQGFRQIEDDRRFHYLLAYSPVNEEFNGEYRRIEVKVRRRDVSVRARTGYIASRDAGALPVLEYERPALAALDRTPPPRDVPVHGRAFSFPADGRNDVALLVTAESRAIAFELDETTHTMRSEFTILAQVRNERGELLRKASQPYRMDTPADRASGMVQSELLFSRQTDLPPGNYVLEYAVHDFRGGRSGAARAPFTVFGPSGAMQVSSLILIRQAERDSSSTERAAPTSREPGDPLQYQGLTLHPNLGTPLRRGDTRSLPFSFLVRGTSSERPTASVELRRSGGEAVFRAPVPVPPPDAAGSSRVVSALQLGDLPAGSYVLSVTVLQAGDEAVRDESFELVD